MIKIVSRNSSLIKRLKISANQNRNRINCSHRLHIRGKGIGKNYKEEGRGEDPCRFSIESVPLPYAPRYSCPFQRMYYTERNNPPFFSRRERTSPSPLFPSSTGSVGFSRQQNFIGGTCLYGLCV